MLLSLDKRCNAEKDLLFTVKRNVVVSPVETHCGDVLFKMCS